MHSNEFRYMTVNINVHISFIMLMSSKIILKNIFIHKKLLICKLHLTEIILEIIIINSDANIYYSEHKSLS